MARNWYGIGWETGGTGPNPSNTPDYLSAEMQAWRKAVVAGWRLEPHQVHLLEAACASWDRAEQARQTLAEKGVTVEGRYGPRSHPAVAIERDSRAAFAKLVKQLDLDPAAEPRRTGMNTLAPWVSHYDR